MLTDKGFPITPRILRLEAKHFTDNQLRTNETGSEQHEISGPFFFGAFHFAKGCTAFDRLGPIDLYGLHAFNMAVIVTDKFLRENVIRAGVIAMLGFVFGMLIIKTVDAWPLWPWIIRGTFVGWLIE